MSVTSKYVEMTPQELWKDLIHSCTRWFVSRPIIDLTDALIAKDPQMGFLQHSNCNPEGITGLWRDYFTSFFEITNESNLAHLVDAGYSLDPKLRWYVAWSMFFRGRHEWRRRVVEIDQFLRSHGVVSTEDGNDLARVMGMCCPEDVQFLIDELGWPVTDHTWNQLMDCGFSEDNTKRVIDILLTTGFVPGRPYKCVDRYEVAIYVRDQLAEPFHIHDLDFYRINIEETEKFNRHFGVE